MKRLFFILISVFFVHISLMSQDNFYDINSTREIKIYFEESNWDHILDSLFQDGDGSDRLTGQVVVDGYIYDSVGIRYKGYSSWNIDSIKNPFNIELDYIIDNQNHMGYDKLKLSNVIHDPSFVREALSYSIASNYMPVSKANFANVYINDILIGLYTNVESVGKDFTESHFGSRENTFFKASPEHLEIPFGENANLSNTHGTDSVNYYPYYDIKSDCGWAQLYELIRVLNEVPDSIESVLDVDRALWMHSFNYSLLNLDSYIGYAQNYYIYQDDNGRFNTILWDLNMSFGSFRLTDGIIPSELPLSYLETLDPLQHLSSTNRPLLSFLLQNDTYKRMYLAHIRTIIEENFANSNFVQDGEAMQAIIDNDVINDPNRFYSYNDFNDNFETTVICGALTYPGIVSIMDARTSYLSSYVGYQNAPDISNVSYSSTNNTIGSEVWITAEITGSDSVFLGYRYSYRDVFSKLAMYDDGSHQDGAGGDNVFGASIIYNSDFQYYLYAENNEAGMFSPERAEYEFYNCSLINDTISEGSIVINEIMASNSTTVSDPNGDFDDWIELYNTTSNDINLSGAYLSDKTDDILKWNFPDVEILANDYLIIWADGSIAESGLHSNFKLSSSGESVVLSNYDSTIIDIVNFGVQHTDTTYGRYPNATGEFQFLQPTFGTFNEQLSVEDVNYADYVTVYPNPANSYIIIEYKDIIKEAQDKIFICNLIGEEVASTQVDRNSNMIKVNTSSLGNGMYILKLGTITMKILISR